MKKVLGILVMATILLTGCGSSAGTTGGSDAAAKNEKLSVTYENLDKFEVTDESKFEFSQNDNGYAVGHYSGDDEVVVIPAEYNGKPVTEIKTWTFNGDEGIKAIVVPDSVEILQEGAFAICSDLEYIKLGSSLKSIGKDCFLGDSKLKLLEIPDGCESIGYGIVMSATDIEYIRVPASATKIDDFAFSIINTAEKTADFEIRTPAGSEAEKVAQAYIDMVKENPENWDEDNINFTIVNE